MNERTRSADGVTRRETLTAVTGATVAGLAGVPTAVVGDSGREKRITTLATGSQSQETVTVSKRWYQHKEQAIRVKEALRNRFVAQDGVHSVGIETDDRTVGGLRGKRVRVAAAPGRKTTLDTVPSSVEGIPVRTVQRGRPEQTDCYTDPKTDRDKDDERDFFGGLAAFGLKSDGEVAKPGTLCCRVFDSNGNARMLTARHIINGDNCDSDDKLGREWGALGTDGNRRPFGGVTEAHQKFDAALLDLGNTQYYEFLADIVEEPSGRILGRVTGDGIDYLHSETNVNYEVRKRGRTTCKETGTIEQVRLDYDVCGITEQEQIVSTTDQADGDSGGPVYIHREDGSQPDNLYLLHIATRAESNTGYAQGSSADVMYRQEGISFGIEIPYDGG